jgi:hypothetical protein
MGAATKEIAELAPINDEAPEPAALEPAEPGDEAEPSAEEAP